MVSGGQSRSWSAISFRVLALLGFEAGLVVAGHMWLALAALPAGLALSLVVAFRPKARAAPGALYTAPADQLSDRGKKLPGQLSVTSDAIIWSPARHATRRGAKSLSLGLTDASVAVAPGPGLADVIVTISPHEERGKVRLITRRSHRLRDLLAPTDHS
jgi:hypothetical protein